MTTYPYGTASAAIDVVEMVRRTGKPQRVDFPDGRYVSAEPLPDGSLRWAVANASGQIVHQGVIAAHEPRRQRTGQVSLLSVLTRLDFRSRLGRRLKAPP